MNTNSPVGVILGVVSILFSTLCLIVMPVFTASIILAPLVGITFGSLAMALRARRTASLTFMFALVPLCGFLAMQNLTEYVGTGYVAFAPLVIAAAVSAWVMVNHARAKRAMPKSTA